MSRHKLTVRDLEDSWACKHAQEDLSSDERVAEIRTLLDEVRADAWERGYDQAHEDLANDGFGEFQSPNPYLKQEKTR